MYQLFHISLFLVSQIAIYLSYSIQIFSWRDGAFTFLGVILEEYWLASLLYYFRAAVIRAGWEINILLCQTPQEFRLLTLHKKVAELFS